MAKRPLSVRLNNPGNIEKGTKWRGLAEEQPHKRFAKFETPEMGARAMLKIFATYSRKYGRRTIRQIVERWAPHKENPTNAYVEFVADRAGINPDRELTEMDLPAVAWAMAWFEAGEEHFTLELFERALPLAQPLRLTS